MERLLLVSPFPPKRDGLATYAQDLVDVLDGRLDVRVATQTVSSGNPSPHVLPVLSLNPWSVRRLARVIARFRPDTVHIQFTVPAYGVQTLWLLLGLAVARRRGGFRTVWTLHEVVRETALLGRAGRMLYRLVLRLADLCVVLSQESERCLVEVCGAPPGSVVVTAHGVPHRDDPRPGDAPDGPIVYFGFLHTDKGIEHLIDAVARLRVELEPGPTLVIAGSVRPRRGVFKVFESRDHRYAEHLRRSAGDGVTFAGYLNDEALDDLLRSAALVVFPYTSVTQSGAINRAVSLGCPVVASDLPGLRIDMPHDAGLVPAGDPAALAGTLGRLLVSSGCRREMAAASLALARLRSGDARAADAIRLYEYARTGGGPG